MLPGQADAMKAYREFLRNGGKVPEALSLLYEAGFQAGQSELFEIAKKESECPVCGKEK